MSNTRKEQYNIPRWQLSSLKIGRNPSMLKFDTKSMHVCCVEGLCHESSILIGSHFAVIKVSRMMNQQDSSLLKDTTSTSRCSSLTAIAAGEIQIDTFTHLLIPHQVLS